jgi:signal transduction histidine kinase
VSARPSSAARVIFPSADRPILRRSRSTVRPTTPAALEVYGAVVRSVVDRLRRWRRDPVRLDLALASTLAVLGLIQIVVWKGAPREPLVGALFATAIAGTVAVRRLHPAVAGVAAQGLSAFQHDVWGSGGLQAGPWTVSWFCSLYALAVWASPRRFLLGAAFVVGTDMVPVGGLDGIGKSIPFAAGSLVVMLLARRVVGDRERRAQLAERERDVAAREAVVEERARIARELHDAIAHNVSVMVVQAGAERRVLGSADASTREVLETIERIGRGALTEMRRLVGMLRSDSVEPLAPHHGLDDLATLVAQVGAAGLPVELHVEGERRDLPVGIELSAYRIVQEALTNALKHAGEAHAVVHVAFGPDSLTLEITDDGTRVPAPVAGGGHGLVGMRERVALYGGRLDAGRNPGGGFGVRVVLPIR